jgi:hypothetical protein
MLKIYNDAEKLYTLSDLPIGMVTFGVVAVVAVDEAPPVLLD